MREEDLSLKPGIQDEVRGNLHTYCGKIRDFFITVWKNNLKISKPYVFTKDNQTYIL